MTDIVGLLGLGARSGRLRIGVDRVRRALQQDELHCVVIAADATGRVEDKVVRLARARRVPLVQGPSARQLGATVGKPPVMVVGVEERALAAGIVGRAPHKGLGEE
ncbi:MAG: ribosomal L7Ae/L30e/S12e/Gadd45 family protein [Gemmatimonadetes bacterium]|jgi:ribosomal protein L7Ae-like RNA K-turn-binding protein|nr:ribosomal L7Ae/L30e/S12e/Gadd45 family protein [Gemmatimonadota bacterium]